MALIIKDRVKEITTTTGTGAVSLGGASATFDAFQSVMSNGDTTFYAIVHTASGTDEWEVGLGTWNTGNTLTRTTVYAGSNGTSAVNFSSGNKDIFMTYPASKAAVAGEDVTFADVTATNITATGTVTLAGDPTSALQAATKEYVDTIAAAGIHYHTPVRVESPSALTATYDNGTSGVGATLTNSGTQAALVIDGVTLSTSDRVLVYNQTNAAHNGIYTVTNTGSASTNWVLTRATDADSYGASDPDALGEGDAYFVKEGDTGAGELYVMNTSGVITFGTTNITFTVIAETAVYSAGTGLTLTGTTFSTNQDISTSASPTFNNITVTGTVDGRDVATDGSKLDGIEAGATADQTAAEIKTAYESNSNTNAFTDAEQTKLSGIETGATADQTASEILTAIKTVDGVGSNLDADLLDGQQGSYYLNTGTTFSGDVSGTYNNIVVANDSHTHDGRYYTETEADTNFVARNFQDSSRNLNIATNATGSVGLFMKSSSGQFGFQIYGDGSSYGFLDDDWASWDIQKERSGPFKVDEGSGLQRVFNDGYHPNADKWTTARTLSLSGDASGSVSWDGSANATLSVTVADNSHSHSNYVTSNAADTMTGRFDNTVGITSRAIDIATTGDRTIQGLASHNTTGSYGDLHLQHYGGNLHTVHGGGTLYANGNTVWHAGNDGSGSGLDADLLDGVQGSSFLRSDANDTLGATLTLNSSGFIYGSDNNPLVQIYDSNQAYFGSTSRAYVTLASSSTTGVRARVGTTYYTIWHSGNDGSGSGLDADKLDGSHASAFALKSGTTFTGKVIVDQELQITNGNGTQTHFNYTNGNDNYIRGSTTYIDTTVDLNQNNINDVNYLTATYLRAGDGTDGYFFSDSNGRTAFAGGDFYIQSISNYYNYATNQYHGNTSGDNHYFRGNTLTGDGWTIYGSGQAHFGSYIGQQENHLINYRFEMDGADNANPAYILLCRNAANNDVNGTIRMDRTSGLQHACSYDVIVSSGSSTNPIGIVMGHALAKNGQPDARLVTATYGGNSYVALEVTNPDLYHETTGAYFTGRLVNSGSNTLTVVTSSSLSNISALSGGSGGGHAVLPYHATIPGNLYLGQYIYHDGDVDTNIAMLTDNINIRTGGVDRVLVDGSGVRLGDSGNAYVQPVSGNYGSIQIDGGAHGGWEGYSIGGRVVFMHDNNTATGIFNDIENEWIFYGHRNGYARMYYDGSAKVETTSTGVTITGDVNSTSDIRYKKNIETIDNALEKVQSLRGVTYDWDNDAFKEDDSTKKPNFTERATGVIAQDVEKVLPEAVRENEDGFKNVAYGNMVGLLIEAIKEQQEQIDALKKQLNG